MHKWKSMHNSLIRHHQLLVSTSMKSRDWLGNRRKHIQKIDCNFRNSHFTSLLANRNTTSPSKISTAQCDDAPYVILPLRKKFRKVDCMRFAWLDDKPQNVQCGNYHHSPVRWGWIGFSRRRQKLSVNRWKYVKKETHYCLYWFMRLSNCDHFSNS